MLPAFPAQPPNFPATPEFYALAEHTPRPHWRSRVLQTYDGTSPHSDFRNTAGSVGRFHLRSAEPWIS